MVTAAYVSRDIEKRILKAAAQVPVVVVSGPRQTGKSTLLRHLFPKHVVRSLDDPLQRRLAKEDPRRFIESAPSLLIDEIQYVPELLHYIKLAVDKDRRNAGRFVLTGSQFFPLMAGLTETLAGRIAIFELLGFSWLELPRGPVHEPRACFEQMWAGFYPDPSVHGVRPEIFYPAYVATYLERDIRQIQTVQDLGLFQTFLQLLAARAGALLNLTDVSKECGIALATAKRWLSLLETTRIVYLLRPYFRNMTKRAVKHPKLYFTDTGLLAYLLRYPNASTLEAGPMAGALFENMLIIEILKRKWNKGRLFELYFMRDNHDNEIDLILDGAGRTTLIEIKSSRTLRREFASSIVKLRGQFKNTSSWVVSLAPESLELMPGIRACAWWEFDES